MIIETKFRSLLKAISWRILATLATAMLVYAFFGKLKLAAAIGGIEVVLKIAIYFLHERLWERIKFGRVRISPFVLWFTGLPLSGKTTIADSVYDAIKKMGIDVERLDSRDVRGLFPEEGFTRGDRIRHLKRVAHLIRVLQNNGICVVASFVSPYREAREIVKSMTLNYVEIYVKASVEECMRRDNRGLYEKALKGEIKNFTGVSDVYEEPDAPDIVLDTEKLPPEKSAQIVVKYVREKLIRGNFSLTR